MNDLESLRYPIGRFEMPSIITDENVQEYIRTLEEFPTLLKKTVENFDDKKFGTPYRENGWTGQQVISHLADAHSIAYAMFKRGLEENNLILRPHNEPEKMDVSGNQSTTLHKALEVICHVHQCWSLDLHSLSDSELKINFFYPGAGRTISLAEFLSIFSWHTKHHLGHITGLKERMGWR